MTDLYQRIEMDPPWPEQGGGGRGAQNHYPLIKTNNTIYDTVKYAQFEDGSNAWRPDPEQCHLWLWVTNNYLPWGLRLMAWLGFEFKTMFIWVKKQMGLGQYGRGATEPCLFGTMGKTRYPSITMRTDFGGPIDHDRDDAGKRMHSRKPIAILNQISNAYPGSNVLEMFSRSNRPGVTSWGNETNAMAMGQIAMVL